jgi:phosphate starvation-inducible PhoH-like protein
LPRTRKKTREFRIEKEVRAQLESQNLLEFKQNLRKKQQVQIIPRNVNQETYLELLRNPKKCIVLAVGPAGTGKTMLGVQIAIKYLREEVIKRIIITRPAVSVDEEHGFLPGTLNEKMKPWTRPIMDVFEEYYHPREIVNMLDDGVIEISPLAYMRGRTFKNAFIVADEMQNTTTNQMKMLLTRLGENSKMVVTGDLSQADRPNENGLIDFVNRYKEAKLSKLIDIVWFGPDDIERHPVVKEVLLIYKDIQ